MCDWDTSLCVCVCGGGARAHKYAAILKVCGACVCVCARARPPAAACVRGGHLSFACAMINGLHRAVQPCMFLGLSFYAVSN